MAAPEVAMHGPVQSQLQRAAVERSVDLSVSTASVCIEPYGVVRLVGLLTVQLDEST